MRAGLSALRVGIKVLLWHTVLVDIQLEIDGRHLMWLVGGMLHWIKNFMRSFRFYRLVGLFVGRKATLDLF